MELYCSIAMFGIQTLTAFLIVFAVVGVTAAIPVIVSAKLTSGIRNRDAKRSTAFSAIGLGGLIGLRFHWDMVVSTFNTALYGGMDFGNSVGEHEALFLPIGFVLLGLVVLRFR